MTPGHRFSVVYSLLLIVVLMVSCARESFTLRPQGTPTLYSGTASLQLETQDIDEIALIATDTVATDVAATGTVATVPVATDTLPAITAQPSSAWTQTSPVQHASPTPQLPGLTSLYVLSATLDYAEHQLAVEERIEYLNSSLVELEEMVLVVEPARYPGAFRLTSLTWEDGSKAQHQLKDWQIRLPLRQPLAPGGRIRISLTYELQLPQTSKYTNLRPRPFGYTDLQANLGDWYPYAPPYDSSRGWLAHEASPFGEYLAYESADFEVSIRLSGAQRDLVIAASSPAEVDGEWLRFRHTRARSFAWSASPFYKLATESVPRVGGGTVAVASYYFPFYEAAGQRVAQTSARALALYERLFGAYPHPMLSVVQADFIDGMEYEGLYFISKDFYNWYRGTESELLVAIAAHETAHQWWYGLVGSDPALEPWLDEALSTYCERLYYENSEPGGLEWWRTYRVDYFEPRGKIDITVYDVRGETESYRAYRDVVYLNGALFVEDLRQLVGDPAFFAFLADYRERYTYRLANKAGFFETLMAHTTVDIGPLVEKYFKAVP